jgi:Ca-activated chloride channel family protein
MKPYLISLIFIVMLLPHNVGVSTAQSEMDPISLTIEGEIADNFANITYSLVFDNTGSSSDQQVNYQIARPSGLYLSNVSARMGEQTFWGKVMAIQEASQKFNESVEANKSAVLVRSYGESYMVELNIKAGKKLYLSVFFEGYLTRNLGTYTLDLLKVPSSSMTLDFSLDLSITSSLATLQQIGASGITDISATSITDGKRLTFTQDDYLLAGDLSVFYSLRTLTDGGKILTYTNGTDNFFIYLLAPEIHTVVAREPREFVFVIDISGSMSGTRIQQAKDAFSNMIYSLDDDDIFNVITFQSIVEPMWSEPKTATLENINTATTWVTNLQTGGGTNFNAGVVQGATSFSDSAAVKVLVVLSDGEPTAGEQNTDNIRNNVVAANTNEAAVYAIAFGQSAEEELMALIAYDSGGVFVKIQPGEEAVEQLGLFYESFATPVALGYSMQYTNAFEVLPSPAGLKGALFNGSEVLQTGRYQSTLTIKTTLKLSSGDQVYTNTAGSAGSTLQHLERIWAHNTIKQWLKMVAIEGGNPVLEAKIVSLAIQYGLVVPEYTALIIVLDEPVVDPNQTEGGDKFAGSDPVGAGSNTRFDQNVDASVEAVTDSESLYVPSMIIIAGLISIVVIYSRKPRH